MKIKYNSNKKIFELLKNNIVIFQCLTKEEALCQKNILLNKKIGFGKWGVPGYILKIGSGKYSVVDVKK